MIIDLNWNKEFAKEREGTVKLDNGNHKLYKCPADHWTIGYGHNLEAHGLPDSMANELLRTMLMQTQLECQKNVKGWEKLSAPRKSVVIDMCFNMGWSTLKKFKKFLAALNAEDWEEAAKQMQDSKWFRQVGLRAEILQQIMIDGEYK